MRIRVSIDRFFAVSFVLVLRGENYQRIPFFVIFFFTDQDWWGLTSDWSMLRPFQIWWWWYQVIMFWWFLCTISVFKFSMSNKRCRRTVNFVTILDFTKELGLKFIFLSSDSFFKFFLLTLLYFEYFIKKLGHHLFLLTGFIHNITKLFVSLH